MRRTERKNTMHRGFTIVELLVSIGILSIILSMGFAGYAKFNQRQVLVSGGQNIRTVLRDAQSRAYTGEVDCTVCNCTTGVDLDGWAVDISGKKLYGECAGTTFSEKSFTLSSHVIVTPYVTPPGRIFFYSSPPGAEEGVVCLSHDEMSNAFVRITIGRSGEISGEGGIQTSCNP